MYTYRHGMNVCGGHAWLLAAHAGGVQVLAGALKDNKRGVVVGSNTFGKGLIQTVVDLSDGSGMAITVARYQTPAGRCAARCAVQLHASCLHACTPPPQHVCHSMQGRPRCRPAQACLRVAS